MSPELCACETQAVQSGVAQRGPALTLKAAGRRLRLLRSWACSAC